ncbi:MAG: aminomethyl-transferring glycine dehydrogenase subunit GcvPB [Candidatus Saelkia tenebricola]|nr:aminomethyl-transferring glycine dehydrogenase subunit GcvPB [Candidatus Saelkia tenebricola]
MRLIFEKGAFGRRGFKIPKKDVPIDAKFPQKYKRVKEPDLPQVSELDVVRHYTNLSRMNFSVDTNFYPLGSCTMKYNPKFTEKIAALPGFTDVHPLLPQLGGGGILTQGSLEVIYKTEEFLSEITGMSGFTMQPLAGAHGELTGAMIIASFHKFNGNRRKYIIVPDSSHGTNPASAAIAGYEVIVIPTDENGCMDIDKFKEKLTQDVAGVMLTCPNTLGLFNSSIKEIADLAHSVGALMYYDGANLNAIIGKSRPGDIGFDIVHLNLHKTFSTPHGGGGPGSGPVGVNEELLKFLPIPRIAKRVDGTFALDYSYKDSIGYIAPFYGNFSVILKAYAYMVYLGKSGLIDVAEKAVLNANYCRVLLKKYFEVPYGRICMHEFVLSASKQKENGVSALDIAKYLIDNGVHPPTIYFPLSVVEAMMIEPTETESKKTLDNFVELMIEAAKLAQDSPSTLHDAPKNMPVGRLDETKAARDLNLRWHSKKE